MTPQDVKIALNHDVVYNGNQYKMTAYILRSKDGKLYQQAELQDSCGNSVTIVPLKDAQIQIIDGRMKA